MFMDNLLVILIVALAGAYIVRRFYKSAKNTGGCGCSSCDAHETCDEPLKNKSLDS